MYNLKLLIHIYYYYYYITPGISGITNINFYRNVCVTKAVLFVAE